MAELTPQQEALLKRCPHIFCPRETQPWLLDHERVPSPLRNSVNAHEVDLSSFPGVTSGKVEESQEPSVVLPKPLDAPLENKANPPPESSSSSKSPKSIPIPVARLRKQRRKAELVAHQWAIFVTLRKLVGRRQFFNRMALEANQRCTDDKLVGPWIFEDDFWKLLARQRAQMADLVDRLHKDAGVLGKARGKQGTTKRMKLMALLAPEPYVWSKKSSKRYAHMLAPPEPVYRYSRDRTTGKKTTIADPPEKPAPGVQLSLLYSAPGAELCAAEARAKSMGLLRKKWDVLPVEPLVLPDAPLACVPSESEAAANDDEPMQLDDDEEGPKTPPLPLSPCLQAAAASLGDATCTDAVTDSESSSTMLIDETDTFDERKHDLDRDTARVGEEQDRAEAQSDESERAMKPLFEQPTMNPPEQPTTEHESSEPLSVAIEEQQSSVTLSESKPKRGMTEFEAQSAARRRSRREANAREAELEPEVLRRKSGGAWPLAAVHN